jgi:hypothetical protein
MMLEILIGGSVALFAGALGWWSWRSWGRRKDVPVERAWAVASGRARGQMTFSRKGREEREAP